MLEGEELRKTMDVLVSENAIRRQLYNYCRAVNRMDMDLLRQVHHPNAVIEYGISKARSLEEGLKEAAQDVRYQSAFGGLKNAHHLIGNILIELDGDSAKVESYVYASYRVDQADGSDHMAVWGRYLDRFERRQGEWKIARRQAVFDGALVGKANVDWDAGLFAALRPLGSLGKEDPFWSFS